MCGNHSSGRWSDEALAQIQQYANPASEQVMVDLIREDLGVTIDPQAFRMFLRHRWDRIAPLAHRIHDGKR